jgi:predicted PurR-regulated permease PerM
MTAKGPQGLSRFALVFFIVCFAIVGYFLFLIFRPFFSVLVWASVLVVVFWPLFRQILSHMRGRRNLAALLTCLLILLLIVLPITLLGVVITHQSISIYHAVQNQLDSSQGGLLARLHEFEARPWARWGLEQLQRWIGSGPLDIEESARQAAGAVSRWLVARGPSVIAGVGGVLFSFFLMFITMFFLFRDGPQIMETVKASNPLPSVYETEILEKFEAVSYATFFGTILTAIVQGAAATILFLALGIPAPVFWGAVVSFVSLVPIVGAFLVWIPMFGYLLITGDSTRAFILLAVGGLVVSSIDNVLKPLIIRGRTDMHPLLVFLSVLGGMNVFGFLGVLLGPLVVAVFLSFLNFYRVEYSDSLNKR